MKPFALLIVLTVTALPALGETVDAGMAVLQNLGELNGQALACRQMAISGRAKSLTIKHSPKTRRYGEIFEAATSSAFLEQGKALAACPTSTEFSRRITELAGRLQATLPPSE